MASMTLKKLEKLVMEQAKQKGFGIRPEEIYVPEKIALIHKEISDAYTAYRFKDMQGPQGFEFQLSDALQRLLHLCGVLSIDIEAVTLQRLKQTAEREYRWEKMEEKHV